MKSRQLIFLIPVILALFIGCSKKKRISGSEYIPQDVLVEVLVDIHLLDAVTEDRRYYRKYNFNDSIELMTPIFDKYHVTREMFDSTMAEYSRHPVLLDKVYDEVIMKLNLMLDELDRQEEEASAEKPGGELVKPTESTEKPSGLNQLPEEEMNRPNRNAR